MRQEALKVSKQSQLSCGDGGASGQGLVVMAMGLCGWTQ